MLSDPKTQPTDRSTSRRPIITVEIALWVGLVLAALVLRLAHLDAAPLNESEAHEAMLALQAATGQETPREDYSPLLFAANAALFFLCGASDAAARLWPALLGGALALAPALLRRRVGRVGALIAGLYLAVSPTALFASRQLDGAAPAILGVMLFLGGLLRFSDSAERPSWLTLSALGLALAVTAGASAYGLLLTLGLAWLGVAWAWPDEGAIYLWQSLRPHLGRTLSVFFCAVLVFSTGLAWNPGGLEAVGGLISAWFARFKPTLNPVASPFAILAVYEPLALFLGLAGLVWVVRANQRFGILTGLWAGLSVLLLTLMPGRAPTDALWIVAPLALLVGIVSERLVSSFRARRAAASEWLYVALSLLLWSYCYLRAAHYAAEGDPLELSLALLALVLQALMAATLALGLDSVTAALRASVLGLGILFLAATLSAGWGSVYVRPSDARELLVRNPTAAGARDLAQTLRDLSWRRTGTPTTLPFTFEAEADSALAWYLRDFSAARRVDHSAELNAEAEMVLVAPREWTPETDMRYVGQTFALQRSQDLSSVRCLWGRPLRCKTLFEWLLFRRAPAAHAADRQVVLWVNREAEMLR